jgi:hypothetical protein
MAQDETKQPVTDEFVPVGARTFNVVSRKAFKPGDKVLVRRVGNQDWIKELGQDTLSVGRYRWKPFTLSYDRVVDKVNGNTITIDAPVFCAIESRWGGGDIVKYSETGRIEQVGIENIRGVSEYDPSVRRKEVIWTGEDLMAPAPITRVMSITPTKTTILIL